MPRKTTAIEIRHSFQFIKYIYIFFGHAREATQPEEQEAGMGAVLTSVQVHTLAVGWKKRMLGWHCTLVAFLWTQR